MNILFLTMNPFTDIHMHNIYSDLMLEYMKNGHKPYIVTPREKQSGEKTELLDYGDHAILKVRIGNTRNVSIIEKGISTVMLNTLYYRAINKFLKEVQFGLILYSTPPITIVNTIIKLKKRFDVPTYLMLKDIFPQNAVDLGMFSNHGIIYEYFRRQERNLYIISDYIGCMSQANVDYIIKNNPYLDKRKVEVCPNGIAPIPMSNRKEYRIRIREQYNISEDCIIYLYGGHLGAPQGIKHLVACLKENENRSDCYFIICGSGNYQSTIREYINTFKPSNVTFIDYLPNDQYKELVAACDVGLVFLDKRFTIPNYPSRILSYMENAIPLLVCSDLVTDVGKDALNNGYGLFCESDDPSKFTACINQLNHMPLYDMGLAGRRYLEQNFTARCCYDIIMNHWVE